MLPYPEIDPVAIKLGPLRVYWYGISYLLGFFLAYWLLLFRNHTLQLTNPNIYWQKSQILDLFFFIALGVIFGGRWGYVLIYHPSQFLIDPMTALSFWERGRSFHGGLIGVLLMIALFCWQHRYKFLAVTDFIAPAVPIGLGLGRLGNFINGELWGRVTDLPFGMIFPHAGSLPRHPSQLYEFILEGLLLFIILFVYAKRPRITGAISGMFLFFYGIFRFLVEYVREPDIDQGFIFHYLTMGQLLSIPMIILGLWLLRNKKIFREH